MRSVEFVRAMKVVNGVKVVKVLVEGSEPNPNLPKSEKSYAMILHVTSGYLVG